MRHTKAEVGVSAYVIQVPVELKLVAECLMVNVDILFSHQIQTGLIDVPVRLVIEVIDIQSISNAVNRAAIDEYRSNDRPLCVVVNH